MGENEKLGFTFEVKPFDFSTFNRFFGATTDWVDEGSSTVPKVPRDSLYPPLSPSPLKEDTQVWNGSQIPSAEDYEKVGLSDATFLPPQTKSCGNGFYVVDELPTGIIRTNIPTDNADFKHLARKLQKRLFEKSCNDYLETLSEVSKSLNPCLDRIIAHLGKTSKRKARKHYKPKFTL